MAQETLTVNSDEDLDAIINRLRQSRTKDVMVVLPSKTRALETLDQFNALRRVVREENINLTFAGGNKTVQGLAKLLGFQIEKGDVPPGSPASDAGDDNLPSGFASLLDTPTSQPTRNFTAPPPGFVMGGTQQTVPLESPPPQQRRMPQDLFSQMGNFQPPDFPTRPVPPPPAPEMSTRDSNVNLFNLDDTPTGSGDNDFNLEMGAGSRTMTYEEAQRQGFFGDEATSRTSDTAFPFDLTDDNDDDVPSLLNTESDNAAAEFKQRSGVRRGDRRRQRAAVEDDETRQAGRRGLNLGVMAAGLSAGVGRFFNRERQPATAVAAPSVSMGRTPLPPEVQRQRMEEKNRYRMFALLGVVAAFVIIGLLLILSLSGGNNPLVPVAGQQKVNVILSTQQITSTARVLLDVRPSTAGNVSPTTTAVPGNSSTVGGDQSSAAGRLTVNEINAGKITVSGEWPAFGSINRPDGVARGAVDFVNSGASARSFGAGTVIYTNQRTGVQYRLVEAVTVPPGGPFADKGRARGTIQASVAGPTGNFEGINGQLLTDSLGYSIGKVEGGTSKAVKVVSKEDRAALEKKLMDEAREKARSEISGRYDPNTQGFAIIRSAEPQCQFTKNVGDEADKFSGTCSVSESGIVYSKQGLLNAVKTSLVRNPSQEVVSNSLKVMGDGEITEENGRLFYQVPVTASLFQPLTDEQKKDIAALSAGKSPADARNAVMQKYNQYLFDISFGDAQGTLPGDSGKLSVDTVYDYEFKAAGGGALTTQPGLIPLASPTPKI